MADFIRKGAALLMTAAMVLPVIGLAAWGTGNENPAGPRAMANAPAWMEGDFWVYMYTGRFVNYTIPVNFGAPINGSGQMTGQQVCVDSYSVIDISDPVYFKVDHVMEWWENGTYTLTNPQGQTSTPAVYKYHSKTAAMPVKLRKSDLATGDYVQFENKTEEYDRTSLGKLMNTSLTAQDTLTHPLGPIAWYRFPMGVSQNWAIIGREVDYSQKTNTCTDTGTSIVSDTTEDTTFALLAATDAKCDIQITPAGVFNDSIGIHIAGTESWSLQGTSSVHGGPPQAINDSGQDSINECRWYSNTAGFIVNWNSTVPTNGELLYAYRYKSIPPNDPPWILTINGQQYDPSRPISVNVMEAQEKVIELTVEDNDTQDTLNWSRVDALGAPDNPPGARLMDKPVAFEKAQTTGDGTTHTHTNSIVVTAKQPKTPGRDNYVITANVSDGHVQPAVNLTFNITVTNVNDPPYVAMAVPDIWMLENSTMVCTTWKMSDIFKDRDLEAGIFSDRLTYAASVTWGPRVGIAIDNDTGVISFTVPDYAWDGAPFAGWDATILFTAWDTGSGCPANRSSNSTEGKLHVVHVNHGLDLSDYGRELENDGLRWLEDMEYRNLDLNQAVFDPDIRYADDALTFTFSGQKNIAVTACENAGYFTLNPQRDWNGIEAIMLKATDSNGQFCRLVLNCTIMPLPDAPLFCETEMDILWNDTRELTIMEAAIPGGPLNHLLLTVSIKDPDNFIGDEDLHFCQWWVNESQGNCICNTGKFSQDDDDYDFVCQWTGAFSAALGPYEVKCVAKDRFGLTATYVWNVTVLNADRPATLVIDSPRDNRTYLEGQSVYFSAWNSFDPDVPIENLTFVWNSSKQGLLRQDRGLSGAEFSFNRLKPGRQIITLTVRDTDGGETSESFTLHITPNHQSTNIRQVPPEFVLAALGIMAASLAMAALLWSRKRK